MPQKERSTVTTTVDTDFLKAALQRFQEEEKNTLQVPVTGASLARWLLLAYASGSIQKKEPTPEHPDTFRQDDQETVSEILAKLARVLVSPGSGEIFNCLDQVGCTLLHLMLVEAYRIGKQQM